MGRGRDKDGHQVVTLGAEVGAGWDMKGEMNSDEAAPSSNISGVANGSASLGGGVVGVTGKVTAPIVTAQKDPPLLAGSAGYRVAQIEPNAVRFGIDRNGRFTGSVNPDPSVNAGKGAFDVNRAFGRSDPNASVLKRIGQTAQGLVFSRGRVPNTGAGGSVGFSGTVNIPVDSVRCHCGTAANGDPQDRYPGQGLTGDPAKGAVLQRTIK